MDSSIIVKNLPVGVYVPELCDVFRCFGNIVSSTVHCDKNKSSSEAYIDFEHPCNALVAVRRMDKSQFKNKMLTVLMSAENEHFKKVFVRNFNSSWDECDLIKAFEDVGTIEDAKISENKGRSNGYGYVLFENHSAAKKAVACMNGVEIDGHALQVERFKARSERENLRQNSLEQVEAMLKRSAQRSNLHVKNVPGNLTEEEFKNMFERYGEISSAKIMTDGRGVSRGFGFVSFVKEDSAARALKRMNGYSLRGKNLEINFKEDGQLRKQYTSLKNKEREVTLKQYKQRSQSVPKLIPHSLNYKKPPNAGFWEISN